MKPQKIIRGYEIAGRMPLFQAWGRDAIREDRKTQTRRVNGLKKINERPGEYTKAIELCDDTWSFWYPGNVSENEARRYYPNGGGFKCPWKVGEYRVMTEPLKRIGSVAWYADTEEYVELLPTEELLTWRWKKDTLSAMFMPTEVARTICQITNIRVERVQDISEEDSIAEGSQTPCDQLPKSCQQGTMTERTQFSRIWDSINKKRGYGWDQNSWVWVLEFKRV